jgi:threonine dehydrogenase-like Zn-dependent dehydrogenase
MSEKTMIPHDELHVVFGTGPVGLAVMRELRGHGKRVRWSIVVAQLRPRRALKS